MSYSFFRIAFCPTDGGELWYTFPVEIGETIEWAADKPGRVRDFAVLLDTEGGTRGQHAMACVMYRNNRRLVMRPTATKKDFKFLSAVFVSVKPEDHECAPGETFKVTFYDVGEVDLAAATPCRFCGRATVDLKGEMSHEEPVCEPWLDADRKQRAAKWN